MKSKLLNELPELIEHQVISEDIASDIRQYYKTRTDEKSSNLFVVFGILGSALVGLGIILIIAHNWDNFSKSVKTFFAFLPMILAQIASGYSIIKKKSSTWKESSGTFLFFTIGACIAMISQIYNIPGDLSGFLLTWTVLGLPLIYVLNSRAVAMLSIVFASYYAWVLGYGLGVGSNSPWLFLVLLLATVPYYLKLLQKEPSENTTALFNWLYALSLTITFGTFVNDNWPLGFLMYALLFGMFYNIGKIPPFNNQQLRRNGYLIIGSLGIVVVLLVLSFNLLWDEILRDVKCINSQEGLISMVLFIAAFFLLLYSRKDKSNTKFNLFQYAFLLFAFVFVVGCLVSGLGAVFSNLLVLALGISAVKIGADTFRFSVLNYGLLIITAVIICRFFDTDMSFILRGILFVLVGLGFFLTNYVMLKKQGNREKLL